MTDQKKLKYLKTSFMMAFSNLKAIKQPMYGSPREPIISQQSANNTQVNKPSKKFTKVDFRGSGIPQCLTKEVFKVMLWDLAEKPLMEDGINPFSDYFLNEGSLIHAILQRWMGYTKLLYGNFQCLYCGKKVGPQLGAPICCYHPMEYMEFSFKLPNRFSFHPDLIVKTHGMTCLGDIKTSKTAWNKDFELPSGYFHQLNSYYWNILNPKYRLAQKNGILEPGKKFDLVFFLFVPRDYYCLNPNKWRIITIKPNKQVWLDDLKTNRRIRKCIDNKDPSYVLEDSLCELSGKKSYDRCWLESICHDPKQKEKAVKEYFKRWKKIK